MKVPASRDAAGRDRVLRRDHVRYGMMTRTSSGVASLRTPKPPAQGRRDAAGNGSASSEATPDDVRVIMP